MMKSLAIFLILLPLKALALPCEDTDQPKQWVIVLEGPEEFMAWQVDPEETKPITMKDGFKLGLKINPVSNDYYRERLKSRNGIAEMVQITLFDLSNEPPRQLAMTYGGANSVQGYSSRGGATSVQEIGPEGIEFLLHKSACVTLESLASGEEVAGYK